MGDTTQIYESNNLSNISRSCSPVAQSQSNILIGVQVKEFLDMASDHTAVKDFVLATGSSVSCFDILLFLAIFCLVGAHPSQRFGKGLSKPRLRHDRGTEHKVGRSSTRRHRT